MSRGAAKGFFAFSAAPNDKKLEFLVKNDGDIAKILCEEEDPQVECSPPQGNGFTLSGDGGRPVHLFSMGSGLGPLRALIQYRIQGFFHAPEITLWQASFTRASLPFADEYDAWRASGVVVRLCLDQDEGPDTGSIIEHLHREKIDLSEAVGYWIGSREFGEAVGRSAAQLGMKPERFLTNM